MSAITEFLHRSEGRTLEFKQDLSSPDNVIRVIVAFANTTGGTVVVGVADNGEPIGLERAAREEERLANLVADCIEPALSPDIQLVEHEGRDFLLVRVPRFPGPFFVKREGPDNGVYIRLGSTNRHATEEQRAELRRQALASTFDSTVCVGTTLADLDLESAYRLFERAGHIMNTAKLETLGVIVRHGETWLPSNGGIILFGRPDVQARVFPEARVQAARFAGTTKAEFLDQLGAEERGVSILAALTEIPAFVRRNTRTATPITGATLQRQELPEYSPIALREVLVNALAHADYSRRGMFSRVAIFSDRMEIENPGGWPLGFSAEDFQAGVSRARNPVIAGVLHKLDVMEGWGTGFERIEQDATQRGYPLPTWRDMSAVLRVQMRPHPSVALDTVTNTVTNTVTSNVTENVIEDVTVNPSFNERQQWLLQQIRLGVRATAELLASHFGVTLRTARRDIASLQEAEQIAFVGAPKTGRYILLVP